MKSYKVTDVTDILLAVKEHNDNAFVELVNRYTPMIKKLIASHASSLTFDELFSEACVALHRAAVSFSIDQREVTFGLYAQICVSRRLSDLVQSDSESNARLSKVDVDSLAVTWDIDAKLDRKERFAKILKVARELLSDYEFQVLTLHIQGYKTREIADKVSKDPKSVDNAKNRLFRRLREVLSDEKDN